MAWIRTIIGFSPDASGSKFFRTNVLILFWAGPFRTDCTITDFNDLSMHQGIGYFHPDFMDIFPDRFPGDSKDHCRFFLFHSLKVNESHEFNLFRQEGD